MKPNCRLEVVIIWTNEQSTLLSTELNSYIGPLLSMPKLTEMSLYSDNSYGGGPQTGGSGCIAAA